MQNRRWNDGLFMLPLDAEDHFLCSVVQTLGRVVPFLPLGTDTRASADRAIGRLPLVLMLSYIPPLPCTASELQKHRKFIIKDDKLCLAWLVRACVRQSRNREVLGV